MGNRAHHVVVVGAGNAALCAAIAALEEGARVTVLEAATKAERGGNTTYTAGAMRTVYGGVEDLRRLMPDLSDEEIATTDFGTYTEAQFMQDMAAVTQYRCDPTLTEILVKRSYETLQWMRTHGIRFTPIYGRQAFKVDGKFKFWGGLTVETVGGGPGLIETLTAEVERLGGTIEYETRAIGLANRGAEVSGVEVRKDGQHSTIHADAVVLAAGGFQSNPEWRTRYLGPGWDLAKVRGTRHNTGAAIQMALDVGASSAGNWSGCHAVAWDMNAPEYGDLSVGDGFQKHSYPWSVMVNSHGRRFVDEGADFRNYTYAKYGREILEQPGQTAWQVYDQNTAHLLRDEYRIREVTKAVGNSLEELAANMEGLENPDQFLHTIAEYNSSVQDDVPFNPNVKDGRGTSGLIPPKSNWATKLDSPPFEAYQVTCGITFTFGGLRITPSAEVVNVDGAPIQGLYACGELVGGIFYFNYPGGTGLTNGAVFGRIAGRSSAIYIRDEQASQQGASR